MESIIYEYQSVKIPPDILGAVMFMCWNYGNQIWIIHPLNFQNFIIWSVNKQSGTGNSVWTSFFFYSEINQRMRRIVGSLFCSLARVQINTCKAITKSFKCPTYKFYSVELSSSVFEKRGNGSKNMKNLIHLVSFLNTVRCYCIGPGFRMTHVPQIW